MSCARGTRITTEVIEAWRSCNFDTLHKALDLRPWERSPLPREVSSLGCSEGEESDSGPSHESWHQAIELQRELIKIAGWPRLPRGIRGELAGCAISCGLRAGASRSP